ncbi:hypothetical protein [Bacillus cereus]|uniref:hypothetical protein n=1 Tax=Bacillus cereus group TaxID=86661 RepID=UPI0018A77AFC|nr:hypothetical protein [Bacillus cereus]MBF8118772.1 hypothetical protein [Bacillus cereus]
MLNRSKLREHALSNNLSTIAARLIVPLGMVTDIDGRIYADEEEIRKQNLMSPRCIPAAFKDLEKANCITKENGVYYNKMAVHIEEKPTQFTYVSLYKFFQKDAFKKLYKRALQFIFYILTSQLPGEWHRFAIERGYITATNNPILRYFYNFKDFLNILVSLIENGLIEVEFKLDGKTVFLTQKCENVRELLEEYCELQGSRKKRTCSINKSHVIRVRIAEKLVKKEKVTSIYDPNRLATLRDLRDVANLYNHDLEQFSQSSLEKVHMAKKKLFDNFGNYGIELYRECLHSFFEEQSHRFPQLMREGKFGSTLINFYVMPVIRMTINQKLEQMKTEYLQSMDIQEIVAAGEPFIKFVTEAAIVDDVINVDTIVSNYPELNPILSNNKTWEQYLQHVKHTYTNLCLHGETIEDIRARAKLYKISNPDVMRSENTTSKNLSVNPPEVDKVLPSSQSLSGELNVEAMFNSIVTNPKT